MSYVVDLSIDKRLPPSDAKKKEAKELLAKKHKEDSKLVKGIFKNLEAAGGTVMFPYRIYPQDPIRYYTLEDGKEYEVPIGVAKHINITCNEKAFETYKTLGGDPTDVPKIRTIPNRQRYQFNSSEYM